MTVLIILIAPLAGRASDRVGSRWLMTVGLVLVSVQLLYFSRLDESATYWQLLVAFLIGGTGMALTMTPSAAAAMRAVPVDRAGVGSAVLNSSRQVGGSLGIALMGAIVAHEAGDRRTAEAFVDGFSAALVVAAGIAFVGALVAAVTVRHQVHDEPVPVAEGVG
jgi:MFS family permease